jgi:hypothetical protein
MVDVSMAIEGKALEGRVAIAHVGCCVLLCSLCVVLASSFS